MSIYAPEPSDLDHALESAPAIADDALTPLDVRLRAVLEAIPLSVRRQGLTLEALRVRLRGVGGRGCHAGALGAALVKLGYERRRDYRMSATYLARWYPRGYGPEGAIMNKRVIRRLRFERPDLFPTYGNRSSEKLRAARREAAKELRLI